MYIGFVQPRVLVLAFLALAITGCEPPPPAPPTKLSATLGALKISATVDGPAFIQVKDKMAIINSGFNKITIERERIGYNGVQIVELPPKTATVDLTITPTQLTVVADDQQIHSAPVGK